MNRRFVPVAVQENETGVLVLTLVCSGRGDVMLASTVLREREESREGGREGEKGREGGREGLREGRRERGREGERAGGRAGEKERSMKGGIV